MTDHLRRTGRRPAQTGEEAAERMAEAADDRQRAASSLARSHERVELESAAIARALKQMIDQWRDKGEFVRIQVLELLFVKGWANKDVAKFLKVSEQQVANYRFAAVKKLTEHVRDAGLPGDVFPELTGSASGVVGARLASESHGRYNRPSAFREGNVRCRRPLRRPSR